LQTDNKKNKTMNKNKFFNWMLMTTMTLGLSLGAAACSSDDDEDENNNNSNQPSADDPYGKHTEAGGACYNMLSLLTAVGDSLPNDWKTRQFEVMEGKVLDESTPFVRTVAVNNIEEAVDYYSSLISANLSSTTRNHTWTMQDIGTMTFTAINQSDCYATIEVDVKQLPKLQQLRLVPASAFGTNAGFDGEPYYRFGDVILDKENCYWVCVRQCYSPNEIDISHWVSFQIITSTPENLRTVTEPGMLTQKLVTQLGNQKPSMWFAAQLLSALARTDEYVSTHSNGILKDGKGFGGLNPEALTNSDLQKVSQNWEQLGIWDKIKPVNMSVSDFKAMFSQQLTYVYNRYVIKSPSVMHFVAQYSDPGSFYVANPSYFTPSTNMVSQAVDMSTYVKTGTGNVSAIGNKALVIRHKTGFNFTGAVAKALDPTRPINSVKTIYRFAEH